MKKITLVDKNGKNRVYIVNNKTQLKRALPYRNPKIVKEEPLPDTIKPAKDQKLYIITGWTNGTELDDFLAAVQRRGFPVSIKTRPMHTEYGFLISDKGLKDLEAKVQYPASYKKYQIDQESYPIIWNNLSWYYEDEWNKWHKQSLPESKTKNYIVKNYNGNLLESVSNFQKKYPKSRIVEACEKDGKLKIKAEADDDNWEQIPDMGSFSHALHMAIDRSAADWYDDFLTDPKNNKQVEQFLEDLKRFAKWFDLPNINNKYQKEEFANLKKGIDEFEHDWREYHKRHSANESFTKSGEIHSIEESIQEYFKGKSDKTLIEATRGVYEALNFKEERPNLKKYWNDWKTKLCGLNSAVKKIFDSKDGKVSIQIVGGKSEEYNRFVSIFECESVLGKDNYYIVLDNGLLLRQNPVSKDDWKVLSNKIKISLDSKKKADEALRDDESYELYFDVRDWCDENFEHYSKKQLQDLADDIDKNSEIFMKMLDDLKMQNADDEVKDKMHEILLDFADDEVNA